MGSQCSFFLERCYMVVTGCQENESCSKVLNFLERLDDRIRCTHEETVAVVKPWEDIGSNKSLGCIFSEKPADWTNVFKPEISHITTNSIQKNTKTSPHHMRQSFANSTQHWHKGTKAPVLKQISEEARWHVLVLGKNTRKKRGGKKDRKKNSGKKKKKRKERKITGNMKINLDTHSKLVVGSHGSKRDVADGSTTAYRGLREQVRIGSRCRLLLDTATVVTVSVLHALLQIFASLT